MIRFLFFIILLSGALLALMGTAALALFLLGRALAAVKDQFRGSRARAGEARLLRDPVYGTIVLPLSDRVIPPREGPAMATAAARKRDAREPSITARHDPPGKDTNRMEPVEDASVRIPGKGPSEGNSPGVPGQAPAEPSRGTRSAFAAAAARCRDLALVTTDRAGRITSCNLGGEELLGIDWRRDAGAHITRFLAGADAAFVAKLTDPAKGKGVETLECPIRVPSSGGEAGEDRFPAPSRGEGPLLSLLVTATALRDEKGRVEGFLFTAHKGKGKPEAVLSP